MEKPCKLHTLQRVTHYSFMQISGYQNGLIDETHLEFST